MSELVERSSLGTDEVRALCAQTPKWVRHQILANVLSPEDEEVFFSSGPVLVVVGPWTATKAWWRRRWSRTT
jgi:hypothetical protein